MLSGPAAAAINHLLRGVDWARARLEPFAGRSVRFEVPPLSATFTVRVDGRMLPSGSKVKPTTVVRLSASALVRLLWLHDVSARQEAEVEGDTAFASALTGVLGGLRWDVEEDLSRMIGDPAAHRLSQTGASLLTWQAKTASNLVHALAEYWTEEEPLIVAGESLRQFAWAVDILRDDAARLEKRIARLMRFTAVPRNSI